MAKKKVYKYETRDGKVEYGTEVPDGAVILGEVGELEDRSGSKTGGGKPAARPAASPGGPGVPGVAEAGERAASAFEQVLTELAERPLQAGVFVAFSFLWAVLVARAIPPLFRTLALDLRRAMRLVLLVLCSWLVIGLVGLALEWVWTKIQWSPRSEIGDSGVTVIGLLAYALAAVIAFRQRLQVGFVQATILATLWLVVTVGGAVLVWIYVLPQIGRLSL